jgi:hypothetical protein
MSDESIVLLWCQVKTIWGTLLPYWSAPGCGVSKFFRKTNRPTYLRKHFPRNQCVRSARCPSSLNWRPNLFGIVPGIVQRRLELSSPRCLDMCFYLSPVPLNVQLERKCLNRFKIYMAVGHRRCPDLLPRQDKAPELVGDTEGMGGAARRVSCRPAKVPKIVAVGPSRRAQFPHG